MNIYPRALEEALLHHAGVKAVAVIGKPTRSGASGWSRSSCAEGDLPPVEELDRTCLERIAR